MQSLYILLLELYHQEVLWEEVCEQVHDNNRDWLWCDKVSLPHCHLCYLSSGSCKFPQLIVIFRVIKGYICLVGENYLVANLLRLGFLDQQICVPLLIDCSLVKDFPQSLDSGSPILIKLVLWSVLDFCMIQSACMSLRVQAFLHANWCTHFFFAWVTGRLHMECAILHVVRNRTQQKPCHFYSWDKDNRKV